MASNNDDRHISVTQNGPPGELERHLRGLILSNSNAAEGPRDRAAALAQAQASQTVSLPQQQLYSASPVHTANTGSWSLEPRPVSYDGPNTSTPQQGSQSPRGTRRRPNQAQRRQMNSQFSIPIDARQSQPQYSANPSFGSVGDGVERRSSPAYQRHLHGNSNSHDMADARRANQNPNPTHSHHSWGSSSSSHGPNTIGTRDFSYASPHGHRESTGPPTQYASRHGPPMHHNQRRPPFGPDGTASQAAMLDKLCYEVVSQSEIERSEIAEKETFRQRIEAISRRAIAQYEMEHNNSPEFSSYSVELKCFGSLSSGFATKASDMDLGLLSPASRMQPDAAGSPIPRLVEKAFLEAGLGARLLSRTRVPIIKLCETPSEALRQGLIAEREKWESGLDNDTHEDQDEDYHEDQGVVHVRADARPNAGFTNMPPPLPTEVEIPFGSQGETRRFQLKQGPTHSLAAYYGLAKRILRRADGRDVTASNYSEFTDADWKTLNLICHAFIRGLFDPELRERLSRFPSLAFEPRDGISANRSLLGVFTQVEGEHMLQTWDNWPSRALFHTPQHSIEQSRRLWNDVQERVTFGADPILYAKEIQLALDRMKRLPVFQLISLEQSQHETPAQYHTRTRAIINALRLPADELMLAMRQAVPQQYIFGIHQQDVRDSVRDYVSQAPQERDLEAVARRHRCLQLARDLERAVEKGLYEKSHTSDILEYANILRSPFSALSADRGASCYIIPLSSESAPLLARIQTLQDPHKMAPNQPRDKYRDHLEFPKTGAGVQCDINFSAHLALQNTLLLRCYSHTDPRVRPMVLFIKHWAKVRGINSGYRGTLSSYGYVLMVLHYLVNIARPFVCPNLQQLAPQPPFNPSASEIESTIQCKGYNIQFWRNEEEILQLALNNQLNQNPDSIGHLLRGFFEYFAQSGFLSNSPGKGFDWGRDVLSLRSQGGLLSKQGKGWTGAKTVFEVQGGGASPVSQPLQTPLQSPSQQREPTDGGGQPKTPQSAAKAGDVKEIRHRYLFAVEDPFELDHNVARTVTHNGIVSIRDEFRRAWRIIRTTGHAEAQENLLQDLSENEESSSPFLRLLDDIHGLSTPSATT